MRTASKRASHLQGWAVFSTHVGLTSAAPCVLSATNAHLKREGASATKALAGATTLAAMFVVNVASTRPTKAPSMAHAPLTCRGGQQGVAQLRVSAAGQPPTWAAAWSWCMLCPPTTPLAHPPCELLPTLLSRAMGSEIGCPYITTVALVTASPAKQKAAWKRGRPTAWPTACARWLRA